MGLDSKYREPCRSHQHGQLTVLLPTQPRRPGRRGELCTPHPTFRPSHHKHELPVPHAVCLLLPPGTRNGGRAISRLANNQEKLKCRFASTGQSPTAHPAARSLSGSSSGTRNSWCSERPTTAHALGQATGWRYADSQPMLMVLSYVDRCGRTSLCPRARPGAICG